ncbi:MAG: hypothetical protein EPN31_08580 [Castellaniella sp.]|uniref:ubiquinone biosynthesis accessory factor UbiJ n=1 Tax=Castellaniella sp. TaxID=1955812 RepID=UPI0012036A14|nr:hypothetical protein [Castellaniella sp.]TAN28206.1 MAG: hypothetical protein EPN31_08580 [Castellaniella sp.]
MRLPFFPPVPAGLLLRGLNALLKRETWARERLAAHAGKSLRLVVGETFSLQASVGSDGLWQSCDAAIIPDVTLSVPADRLRDLPGVWHEQGLSGVVGLTRIQGDAGFAQLVSDLAGTLRWDVEDDLSRVVGDVLAVRLVAGVRDLAAGTRQALSRARDNLGEYLGDESGLAVRSPEFLTWSQRRQHLADRLDGLELRLRRLEQAC